MSVYSNPELCIGSKTVHVIPELSTGNASWKNSVTTYHVLGTNFYQ